jgi:hopanoid biosynthesis associated protein HpnK
LKFVEPFVINESDPARFAPFTPVVVMGSSGPSPCHGGGRPSAVQRPRLIVNADDFGSSEEVNRAVIRAHCEGILTSCSLMVSGAAFESATRLAKVHPRLGVGIHLVTIMGRSVLPAAKIPHIVDSEGNFSCSPVLAGFQYYFSKQARVELRRELEAQFEAFRATGLTLAHVDSHLHMHVHPVIFRQALELGRRYGAKRMRVPTGELRASISFEKGGFLRKLWLAGMFGLLGAPMKRRLAADAMAFPDRVYGNLQSGKMSREYILHALQRLSGEVNEIYVHPAVFQAGRSLSREELQCAREFDALVDGTTLHRVGELSVELAGFAEVESIPS